MNCKICEQWEKIITVNPNIEQYKIQYEEHKQSYHGDLI